jgi:protein-tyrosine-phosphatase
VKKETKARMPKQILFICIYNLQRSVAAEYFFNNMLLQTRPDCAGRIRASSAGFLGAEVNKWFEAHNIPHPDPIYDRAPSVVAQEMFLKRGMDISEHRSRPVNKAIIDQSDIIVPLLTLLKGDLISAFPESEPKVILPSELLGQDLEFNWEDTAAVPNDSRMYEFAHLDRDYVNSQIKEVEQFVQRAFYEIIRRLS